MSDSGSALRHSPLDAAHRALNGRMVPFGGWELPVQYPTGTVAEHLACRQSAVVFDVSHLGTVRVEGAHAFDRLQETLTNDLSKIGPGRAQYTHLLDDTGSVLDDIIVWWVREDVFDVMPNASNTDRVLDAVGGTDTTANRAVLAVQGPEARALLADVFPAAADVARFRVAEVSLGGAPCVVAGTGYTGEDGVEIAVPVGRAQRTWDTLIAAGILPAGLGARDTLRLEAGLPLHGHELGAGITPLQAGLGWVIGWNKANFRGRPALERERADGVKRILRGVSTAGRRPLRAECPVLVNGTRVGITTSGNYSPVLEHGIALAFVPPSVGIGDAVQVDVRGTMLDGEIVALPFVKRA